MRANALLIIALVFCPGPILTEAYADSSEGQWSTWRGPNSTGVAPAGNPPIHWSETKNIKWKIALPGEGQSTPVVWGDKMFIQTTVTSRPEPAGENEQPVDPRAPRATVSTKVPQKFNLVCLDRNTGRVLWQKTAMEVLPHEGHHPTGSFAPYSPVTDGEYVWASFGSRGLYCYDLDGNQIWGADLIRMHKRHAFGEGSSPVIAGNAIIVVADHEGDSKIFAFDKKTGERLWVRDRDEVSAWSTPVVARVDGVTQVIVTASNLTRSYDPRSGVIIWECAGLTANVIPTPVLGFGNVYAVSGRRGFALQAIELGHTGDLTGSDAIVWEIDYGTPYVASPLLYGERIYVTAGLFAKLSCFNAKDGTPLYEGQKIAGLKQLYASPIGVADRIYIVDRDGTAVVLKNSDTYEVLATNVLDDGFDASPIVVGDELYLKGNSYLYCIAKQ